jgi:hypothetical protein
VEEITNERGAELCVQRRRKRGEGVVSSCSILRLVPAKNGTEWQRAAKTSRPYVAQSEGVDPPPEQTRATCEEKQTIPPAAAGIGSATRRNCDAQGSKRPYATFIPHICVEITTLDRYLMTQGRSNSTSASMWARKQ